IVEEEHRDRLAAIGGVQDLRRSDRGQVAVTLIADDDAVRPAALESRSHGGRAAVRRLNIADVEIVVGKHRAADRTDENRAILQAELVDGARNQFVRYPVAATGTVVGLAPQLRFPLVQRIEALRLLMNNRIAATHGLP